MKNGFFAILFTLFFVLSSLPVHAENHNNGMYAGLKVIGSYQTVWPSIQRYFMAYKTQPTIGGGIFLGYDFNKQYDMPIRAELEYAIRSDVHFSDSGASGGDSIAAKATWGLQTVFANIYFDYHNSSKFTPYVGVGLGTGIISNDYQLNAVLDGDSYHYKNSKTNVVLAGNFNLGVSFEVNENLSTDFGYRNIFIDDNEVKFAGVKINTLGNSQELSFGLRYAF